METTDYSDHSNNSSTLTSSTDSDSNSVLSVIFNQAGSKEQDDKQDEFTYGTPLQSLLPGSNVIASCVYVLIDERRSMSADMRVMWYLKRLGTVQTVDEESNFESPQQCKIMSFIPRDNNSNENSCESSLFVMDAYTHVYFLTAVYNMVYCLDMSPSNISVDMQRNHVMLDEMIVALKRSIEGFIRPFIVPGSNNIVFKPQVYVTVIVHTPFYTSLAQQVLVQGWLINNNNFNEFIRLVTSEMNRLENALAKTKIIQSTESVDDLSEDDVKSHKNNDQYFSDDIRSISNKSVNDNVINCDDSFSSVSNNNPDSGFINTLRYGMLAVRLLPRSSISNLIVITDGMITLADIQVLDSVLNQLRCIGVACSFMHVSSQFHPHSSHGHVPYSELMQLIATATSGTYLNSFPKTTHNFAVNYYHDKFLMWSFKRGDGYDSPNNTTNLSCTPPRVRPDEWTVRNPNFYGNRETQLVSKKQISDHVQAQLENIVCCRMREGFLIEDIQLKYVENTAAIPNINNSSILQLKFILPWTNHIYIEYELIVKWPPQVVSKIRSSVAEANPEVQVPLASTTQPKKVPEPPQPESSLNIHYTVSVKGPYEFLHDITCGRYKKSQQVFKISQPCQFQLSSSRSSSISISAVSTSITKKNDLLQDRLTTTTQKTVTSKYRQALIARFWSTMRSIVQTDLLVKHLETYSPNTGHLLVNFICNNPVKENENHEVQKTENQTTTQIQPTDDSNKKSSNLNNSPKSDSTVNAAATTETKSVKFSASEVQKKSPLRSEMPLFHHLPTNSNTTFSLKQTNVKLNDQLQSYTDQQYQHFADFWKPVCTLDPDSQWPKWFSTYRIGGGVLLLRHDRPLPRWLHTANTTNGRYQTLTCRKSAESLFALLKQWCTFVLIDEHSYVKCLDQSDTLTDNVSFCIAQISLRPPSCCCVVLHLAFQSCVPASVHHKIIDELKKDIQLLDSTTAAKRLNSIDHKQILPPNNKKKIKKKRKRKESEQSLGKKKSTRPQKYVYFLDKPLEKILIRYERIPSQFTTVIFPDGSQPCPAVKTSNIQNQNSKSNIGKQHNSPESTGVELKAVTTTTTLSRYLYQRRWIWSSGCSYYSKCSNSASQKLQLQLDRTLSMLTKIRLREGFRFAHSSAGIINMVLQVDMIEGSQYCPSTPTSQCVIQYVLFPPNILHNHQQKEHDYASIVDILKKKTNDDEKSSTSSIEEQQQLDKRQKLDLTTVVLEGGDSNNCCVQHNTEDDYQLITECWIEPQHGSVVPDKSLCNNYMSGLMYEELADAMWRVDSDCIGSLFTFQHMQYMCADPNISTSNLDIDLDKKQNQNKTTVIDDGRIYKLPFTFSLVNLLPKCKHHSSMTFDLFTATFEDDDYSDTDLNSVRDVKKVNHMLERSFYSRLRSINNRSFNVNDSITSDSINGSVTKVNDKEIGQCFVKRVNDTRLILTVAPPFVEEKYNIVESYSQESLQPLSRSRANTWHYTKRSTDQESQSLSAQPQDDSIHYYRTMSVGSYSYYKGTNDPSLTQMRSELSFCASENQDTLQCNSDKNIQQDLLDFPTNVYVEVYDCRQEDVENFLMSDSNSFDHTLINDLVNEYTEDSNSDSSTTTNGDEDDEGNLFIASRKKLVFEEPVDPLLLNKYLQKIQIVYDRSLVTTVFHALHLGLNVRYLDVQRAVDKCQHRLITFDITDYIKVVCDHFKKNTYNCSICPGDNKTLKSHHDMIHSTFSSTLDRHMLKPVTSHPDYYFYDFIDNLDCDDNPKENYYANTRLSSNSDRKTYLSNSLMEHNFNSINFDMQEVDEQDLFPLFVHLVCTVKTSRMTKNQSVRSLPTCILDLISQDNDKDSARNLNFDDLRVSLDVYCLMLPNNDYEDDDGDENNGNRYMNTMNSSEQLHFMMSSNSTTLHSTKQNGHYENPFIYLSSSLPPRHAQGLAAFIAEVEWCMHDEMATGLLNDPVVTPNTLEKVIEHISNSPNSSSNIHQQIPVHFVVPSPSPSKYNSVSLFLQKLNKLNMILDHENEEGLYTLEKSSNDTYYVVKKHVHLSPNNSSKSMNNEETEMNCDSEDDTEYSYLVLPNFWIILKIQADQQYQKDNTSDNDHTINTLVINVYFHCRFTELDVGGKYSIMREIVEQNVLDAATIVNQTLLLCRLHDTRTCDPLLEPIIEDVINSDDDENGNKEVEKVTKLFTLGQFKCPVVWSTKFSLHPRLRHTTSMVVLGVQVLHSVLEKLSVRNRRNMFVYKESTGSVFYLRLYENLSQQQQKNNIVEYDSDDDDSISRCSSATSTTATVSSSVFPSNNSNFSRKYSEDLNVSQYMVESKSIQTPGSRSLGGYYCDSDSKDVEELTLKVHGISPVGTEIRVDLVEVLQNRLNDALLEVLTSMLYRNPVCKLYPDDVRYIQPCEERADNSMRLSLPIETKVTKQFIHNLKRSAATLFLYPPKYASRHHKFNFIYEASDNIDKPIIRSFFILNQQRADGTSGIRHTSGNRGLACVLYDIYSSEDNSIDNLYDYPTDPELFEKRILATCIEDDLNSNSDYSGYIKVFVWRRGRINIEALRVKLMSIVTYALWDIYIERFLWEQPIIIEQPSKVYVNPLCIQYLAKWIAFGARISVPLARHSHIKCRIHINHVLREFKAHLSWFKNSESNNLPISIRYFYISRMEYGQSKTDCVNSNLISGSTDPLLLEQIQDDSLMNNFMFKEWHISSIDSVICPPSAACVLIIVTVTSIKKNKHKRRRHQNQNKDSHSESDTDGFVVPEDEENTNSEEDKKVIINNDQSVSLNSNSFDSMKQNAVASIQKYHKHQNVNTASNKINKLLLLTVSGQSVHSLSYNCHNNDDDQSIAIHRLSRWLEWRRTAFTAYIYQMMGLKNSLISSQYGSTKINTHLSRIKNNLDLLLDFKSYSTAVEEQESFERVTFEKHSRFSKRTKPRENDSDDKKNKSLQYNKDVHDFYIEQLVRNSKQQRRLDINQKILHDLWIQGDAIITKEVFRVFYNHSRLIHFCLTPLLFLPRWRIELSATREHLLDAVKTKHLSSIPPPRWHKRLCARLTNAYAHNIETNPLFSGFQAIQIIKSRTFNESVTMDMDYTKSTTCYYKKSVPGSTGGLLLIEMGICQPFYYVKLSSVEIARFANQVEYFEDKYKPMFALLDQSDHIIQNMHLHSFTYDFHIRVLSDRLNKLVHKQKTGRRNNYSQDLSTLLEHKNSASSSTNKSGSGSQKNSVASFLDDFLEYYKVPPLYSSCLVLAGVIKRTQIPVTGLQLYEYLLDNCSEDCDGMAVIKICDSSLIDGDDGASLFDDDDNETNQFIDNQNSLTNDLTDFILVHHMAGSDIQRRQELEMKSNGRKSESESNNLFNDCEFEVCGLYDATLVMTLSSVKELLLDTSNEITLSYYVLLTNNENDSLDKKETALFKTSRSMQQRHSTPIHPSDHRFDQANNLFSSSVPSNSLGNTFISELNTCWGSLDKNNTYNNQSQFSPNDSPHIKRRNKKYSNRVNDDLNSHHQLVMKKRNLIKFYEKKAAELVAHAVDTAANRCRMHLLWQIFSAPSDQHKIGFTGVTFDELRELVNKSGLVQPLSVFDKKLGPLLDELIKGPQWFIALHKLIMGPVSVLSSSTTSARCRIFSSTKPEHQYLVILPNRSGDNEFNTFIIIDNGFDSTDKIVTSSDSLINIVFRRNKNNTEEVNNLVETVGKAVCYYIWRTVATSHVCTHRIYPG